MKQVGYLGMLVLAAATIAPSCPARRAAEAPARQPLRLGIDVLLGDSLGLVRGRRVGLVTHQAAVDGAGSGDVERLRAAGVTLVALFSPEHGWRGAADPGAEVASTVDSATGLPIYSLYGQNSAPTDTMLAGVEVLVVDFQDAGARYFTYLWTVVNVMRAAAAHGLPVVLLDRPNPIGAAVQGNVLDSAYRSPVGLLAIPMRHGMTLGELARLARIDFGLTTDLRVMPVSGWRRAMFLDETGLPFRPPSPNLPSLESLLHYPGLCLFEGTNLSVGRGTDHPFQQVGAPWLDTSAVVTAFRAARVPGVEAVGVAFVPTRPGDGKYADTALAGIRLKVTDRSRYDPTLAAVTLLGIIRGTHPSEFAWLERQFDRLAGGPGLRQAVEARVPAGRLVGAWVREREAFLARRSPALLYP
jgi:uncharacterized protein YbbC (DUF1343 family)